MIFTAIATTKIPELSAQIRGFWFMVSDAHTDFAMLCALLFLIIRGGGAWCPSTPCATVNHSTRGLKETRRLTQTAG